MTGKTHILGGLASSAAAQYFVGFYPQSLLFFGAGAVGAILPDICHGGSKIGRKIPVLARLISLLFGHRTVTHSLLFVVLLGVLLLKLPIPNEISIGILVGVCSHLVLDAATTRGIELFWPVRWKVRLPIYTHTGGKMESLLFAALCVFIIFFGGQVFL
ncbi:MAG TPA: metal-dependent hydrolase [Bacillales bacterium]|nr:metal-dependent hydrolase [Bacillales bacterium]